MEHSLRLKSDFFKPWVDKIEEYCKIGAGYSIEMGEMVAVEPRELNDLQFYDEAISHLENYKHLVSDWETLKQTTLKLNK